VLNHTECYLRRGRTCRMHCECGGNNCCDSVP
jgi:hypothetical protein